MGGEKYEQLDPAQRVMGSPPHGRGKAEPERLRKLSGGITPAWAGKSLFCFTAAVPIQDHPRVGGEKVTSTLSRIPK